MNICRWCGGKSQGMTFCSPECAGAAAELPELVNKTAEPAVQPRRVSSPKSSWALGLLAGALLGVGVTLAMGSPEAPVKKVNTPRCEVARAKAQVRAVTQDFVRNGLAGIWDGRVDEPQDLSRWFVAGDATAAPKARIFFDQSRRRHTRLLDVEVVDVRLAPTLDHASADFFLEVAEGRAQRCYSGTFQWISQDNGTWLRSKASILRATPCR